MRKEKKQQSNNIKRDINFEKLLNSKITYLIILVILLIYLFQDDRLINITFIIQLITFSISIVIILIYLLIRYFKYKQYYTRKYKDIVYVVSLLIGLTLFTFIFQGMVKIPFNYFIIHYARNQPDVFFDCEITDATVTGIDRVNFIFKGNLYSRYLNINGLDHHKIKDLYKLRIRVKKSFEDIYIIQSMSLIKKSDK